MNLNPKELITKFLNDQDVEETTKRNYRNTLNSWVTWLILHGISWGEVTTARIIQFRNDLLSKGKSTLTINTYICIISKFYKYLADDGDYPDIIRSGIKRCKKYTGFKRKPLNYDQVAQLLNSINTESLAGERNYLIINLMIQKGLRNIEISRLNIEDFKRQLSYNQYNYSILVTGKGSKEKMKMRTGGQLGERIDVFIEHRKQKRTEPVFTILQKPHEGDRMSSNRISMMIKNQMRRAGIDDPQITAHSLRHTSALIMLDQGRSLYEIQVALRHTTTDMTRNYLRFAEEEKRFNSAWDDEMETRIEDIKRTGNTQSNHDYYLLGVFYMHREGLTFDELLSSIMQAYKIGQLEAEGLISSFIGRKIIEKRGELYFYPKMDP